MMDYNKLYPGNTIHPTAWIHPHVEIGTGNKIGPYCVIGAHAEWKGREDEGKVIIGNNNTITGLVTIDSGSEVCTVVWKDCYIMKGVHVGHDAVISDGVTLSCKAIVGGHAVIEPYANLGLGAIVHQKHRIAEGVMLGMGTIVPKKVITEPYKVYVGNPARLLGDNIRHPNYSEYIKRIQ